MSYFYQTEDFSFCKSLFKRDYKCLIHMFYHSYKKNKTNTSDIMRLLQLFGFTFIYLLKNNVCCISSIQSNEDGKWYEHHFYFFILSFHKMSTVILAGLMLHQNTLQLLQK